MKQVNNDFDACYYLTKEGKIYNSKTDNYIEAYKDHSFKLKTTEGNYKKITLRELYKIVYDELFIIDNVEDLEGEQWKPIERTDNLYWISDKGRVKSYKGYEAIILKPSYVKGYERVDIYQDGSRCGKLISRLVAAAFLLPPAAVDMQLHHRNGCKTDNSKENLVWLTPAEHRAEHKRMKEAAELEQQEGEIKGEWNIILIQTKRK